MHFFSLLVLMITIMITFVLVSFPNQNQNIYAIFTIDKKDNDDSSNVTNLNENLTNANKKPNAVAKIILTDIKYKSEKFSDNILGQVTNVGNETAEKVRVLLSYYDRQNFLIDTGYVSPEQDTLEPGQNSRFNIRVMEDIGDDMEAYKISFKWSHPDGSKGTADDVQVEDEEDYLIDSTPKKLTDKNIEKLGLFER